MVQDGFVFASNFDPNSVPGAAGLNLKKADSKTIIPGDYDNVMPRVGFAWTPFERRNFVLRGGYGMFYERTTGGFANSLRQAPPFFRELQLNNLGDYNVVPTRHSRAADSVDERRLRRRRADPRRVQRSEQRVRGARDADGVARSADALHAAVERQHAVGVPDQLAAREWATSAARATTSCSSSTRTRRSTSMRLGGFLPRPGVPGGGFTGNYYDLCQDRVREPEDASSRLRLCR